MNTMCRALGPRRQLYTAADRRIRVVRPVAGLAAARAVCALTILRATHARCFEGATCESQGIG